MEIKLHKRARTTPAIRLEIAASEKSAIELANQYGITVATVYKWRHRKSPHDLPHTAHHLQTTLSEAQEAVVVELRKTLLLSLDDLTAVSKEFIDARASRSCIDRCLRRHGVSNLQKMKPKEQRPIHKAFKDYEPGFLHMDVKYLPQMADENSRSYLFVCH